MAKIAVSSQGDSPQSMVDPRFGRAAYFVVREEGGEGFSVIDNSAAGRMSSGAGIQAAENLARAGVSKVFSGKVGPKAMNALRAAGIEVIQGAQGRVAEVLAGKEQGAPAPAAGGAADAALAGGGMGMGAGRGCGRGGGRGGGTGRGGGRGGCRR